MILVLLILDATLAALLAAQAYLHLRHLRAFRRLLDLLKREEP